MRPISWWVAAWSRCSSVGWCQGKWKYPLWQQDLTKQRGTHFVPAIRRADPGDAGRPNGNPPRWSELSTALVRGQSPNQPPNDRDRPASAASGKRKSPKWQYAVRNEVAWTSRRSSSSRPTRALLQSIPRRTGCWKSHASAWRRQPPGWPQLISQPQLLVLWMQYKLGYASKYDRRPL